ncbi:Poc1a [Symbiodinium natans]|uniref:Poc1a protein n=1 Tax=Symbiodinium natans TaxID=878477 RepID=A0A812L6R2_9DINO|nr:Poc1a [Symbiodinium natans]
MSFPHGFMCTQRIQDVEGGLMWNCSHLDKLVRSLTRADAMQGSDGEPSVVRTFQGASDLRLTAATLLRGRDQVAAGTQDGSLLLWSLAPGRPRPQRLTGQSGSITCVKATNSGRTLVSASTDSTVAIWKMPVEKKQGGPAMLKLHFSPVRCCDISTDDRLLLTASDDKSVKLTWLAERRFAAAFAGHSNWVRSASLSSTSTHMVSGGDDKAVKLWDVERKCCLQTFSDSASSITCTRFGLGDHVVVASSWDSSINLWDVRSYGIRQHYGRAHGGSPITQVAVHPHSDLILSSSSDRQLRVWDLRAGRLCSTILGHDRPVHSCCWDEAGDHFASCDSEIVLYWSCPPLAAPTPPALPEPSPATAESFPSPADAVPGAGPEATLSPKAADLLLEAAWAGQPEVPNPRRPTKEEERQREALPETVARLVEKMVTDMDTLTASLAALEARLARTEAITAEVAQLLQARAIPKVPRARGEPVASMGAHSGAYQSYAAHDQLEIHMLLLVPPPRVEMLARSHADPELPNLADTDFYRCTLGQQWPPWLPFSTLCGLAHEVGEGTLPLNTSDGSLVKWNAGSQVLLAQEMYYLFACVSVMTVPLSQLAFSALPFQGSGYVSLKSDGEGRAAVAYDLNRLLVVMVAMRIYASVVSLRPLSPFYTHGDLRPFAQQNAPKDDTSLMAHRIVTELEGHLHHIIVRRDTGLLSPTVFPLLVFPLLFVQQETLMYFGVAQVVYYPAKVAAPLATLLWGMLEIPRICRRIATMTKVRALLSNLIEYGDEALVREVYSRINMANMLQAADYEVHEILVEKALAQGLLDPFAKAVLINGLQKFGISRRRLDYVLDLIQSCKSTELTELKSFLDSTGDYNSLYKLVYVDIRDSHVRDQVLSHIHTESCIARRQLGREVGIKVLSDIDDTLLCSGGKFPAGCDDRLPKHMVYPGCGDLFKALDRSWSPDAACCNLVFLSARPHVYKDLAENKSFIKFKELFATGKLHCVPSLLPGSLALGMVAVIKAFFIQAHGWRDVGERKAESYWKFKALYEEYDFIIFGDNGQGDLLAGQLIRQKEFQVAPGTGS